MKTDGNLIVFQEGSYCFGIFSKNFDRCLSLSKVDILHSSEPSCIWSFKGKEDESEGSFVHLGSLFGHPMINFSQSGHIFLRKAANNTFLGVMADNFRFGIPRKKIPKKNIASSRFKTGIPDIVSNCFRITLRYRRRNIFIIEPRIFFGALGMTLKRQHGITEA